jgi:hypothetical protein
MKSIYTYEYSLLMAEQYILHVPVKENTHKLYMERYYELKRHNPKATHDELMKTLLGFR